MKKAEAFCLSTFDKLEMTDIETRTKQEIHYEKNKEVFVKEHSGEYILIDSLINTKFFRTEKELGEELKKYESNNGSIFYRKVPSIAEKNSGHIRNLEVLLVKIERIKRIREIVELSEKAGGMNEKTGKKLEKQAPVLVYV